MTRCHWCNADVDREMPNGISPHATWCPYYRREERIREGSLAKMLAYAERQQKEGLPTHVMPLSKCLACGGAMNMATGVSNGNTSAPGPGDLTICLLCGHIMSYGPDQTLRELTDAEAHDAAGDKDILKVQEIRARRIAQDRARHSKSN